MCSCPRYPQARAETARLDSPKHTSPSLRNSHDPQSEKVEWIQNNPRSRKAALRQKPDASSAAQKWRDTLIPKAASSRKRLTSSATGRENLRRMDNTTDIRTADAPP